MRNRLFPVLLTGFVMLSVSRFLVRIVDATVQIDGNILMLSLLLIPVNLLIVYLSLRLFGKSRKSG
ncbi:MAG: hypothetical protein IKF46_01210 [Erysipelotrichaceae bacterium]|nr:hypothetical protein [Erysipelotrichaceae bacterium]